MLKVILGSLGAFLIFDNLVSWKWLVVGRNGVKFGPQRWEFSVYRIVAKLLQELQPLCYSFLRGQVIVCHLVKQSTKPLAFLFSTFANLIFYETFEILTLLGLIKELRIYMLPLTVIIWTVKNSKSHIGVQPLGFALSDIEMLNSRSHCCWSLISCKRLC